MHWIGGLGLGHGRVGKGRLISGRLGHVGPLCIAADKTKIINNTIIFNFIALIRIIKTRSRSCKLYQRPTE